MGFMASHFAMHFFARRQCNRDAPQKGGEQGIDSPSRWLWWISCVVVLSAALWIRSDDLGSRPFHADEATGAAIIAKRMAGDGGRFDPTHFHGPLLGDLAIPLCRWFGESRWQELNAETLRLLPVIAGWLLCLGPFWICRHAGRWPPILAAACLASSPLLVYYSRMLIHEMLLAALGIAAMTAALQPNRSLRRFLPGMAVGAMFATKETMVISLIAWAIAAYCILPPRWRYPQMLWHQLICHRQLLISNAVAAAAVAAWCYSDAGRHPSGIVDAIKTFFVYQTGSGHDKPALYYANLLLTPHAALGSWWTEIGVLLLALIGWGRLEWGSNASLAASQSARRVARFLAVAALVHGLIYSLIAYKTPWLMCLPWAHVCLLAGFAVSRSTPSVQSSLPPALTVPVIAALLTFQGYQAVRSAFRFATDSRNRLAYVPTHPDVMALSQWLFQLSLQSPHAQSPFQIAVIGADYWPLPWYLRSITRVGYWQQPPAHLKQFAVVIAMPESAPSVTHQLQPSHTLVPRSLRDRVPILVAIHQSYWNAWMQPPSSSQP